MSHSILLLSLSMYVLATYLFSSLSCPDLACIFDSSRREWLHWTMPLATPLLFRFFLSIGSFLFTPYFFNGKLIRNMSSHLPQIALLVLLLLLPFDCPNSISWIWFPYSTSLARIMTYACTHSLSGQDNWSYICKSSEIGNTEIRVFF